MTENRFNLIDEKWIPVTDRGKVSLRTIFSDETITALGGNPVEKIAVFKLLLAIAQSAYTPENETDWKNLRAEGLQQKVLEYLDAHYDCFWLYGERPFLQMKEVKAAAKYSFGTLQMEIATGNTSVVTEIQVEKEVDDSEKALLVLLLMGFAFGGKKADNSVVLTCGYTGKANEKGKPSSAKYGSSLGFQGMLHSFVFVKSILSSVYFNSFTQNEIRGIRMYPNGIGTAPWEKMPTGEDDDIVKKLKNSYMGRLIPMNRFVLLDDDGIHNTEGIAHPGYESYVVDPSVTVSFDAKPKPRVLWADPEKKPWRMLTSMLSFLEREKASKKNNETYNFICLQLKNVVDNKMKDEKPAFSIWSGGVRVSSNAGEQYLTGTDDFVESESLFSGDFTGTNFYAHLKREMEYWEIVAGVLGKSISRYFSELLCDGKSLAGQGVNLFWQLCEGKFQTLIDICDEKNSDDDFEKKSEKLRKEIYSYALQIYDEQCPNLTARQLEAWAKNRLFRINKDKKKKEDN